MFPHGGGGWSNSVYPPEASSPFPRDPRTAARPTLPNTNQTYEAGGSWTQSWSQPAQWTYPCLPTPAVPPVPFPNNWIPNVAPQPGVNCPPIGVPPPGGDWNNYTGVSDKAGSAENKSVEQGSHEVNGRSEGTTDLSLFLSNYCNPKQIRHLVEVPVSPARDVAEAKICEPSGAGGTRNLLERTTSEAANGMPIETLVNTSRKPNGELPLESSDKPIPVGVESMLHNKGNLATSMKRKVVPGEQTDLSSTNSGNKRLQLETSSFAPSLQGNTALLESTASTGKMGAPLEKWDSATKSANSAESQLKPGGSISTWAAMCRERGMTLGKDRTVSTTEKRTSPGKPERTTSSSEKQTNMDKCEKRFSSSNSSRERGTSLVKSERHVSSRENEASLGKPDRTTITKDTRPFMGNHDWPAHGMEKVTCLEKADSGFIVQGSREPYTPESPGTTDVRLDNLFLPVGDTGGGEACVSQPILGNIGNQKASDILAHKAQGVAENTPDPRTAAILAKKEEIEREYEQNCKTFFLVAAMMLEQEPSIQQMVVSGLRKTLREISKHGVKELENFIERYDEGCSRR